ncbi:hypothetical protein N7497_012082 [Penicillium chrysogenum]|nr:hypothetical protein N7497_012082 [Penicillium chrysogenum]
MSNPNDHDPNPQGDPNRGDPGRQRQGHAQLNQLPAQTPLPYQPPNFGRQQQPPPQYSLSQYGTRPHRTWLRFTRIKDMFPVGCIHCQGRTALAHLPMLKHRKEPTKEQLRDGERPSLVGTVDAVRSVVRDLKPRRMDGAATV